MSPRRRTGQSVDFPADDAAERAVYVISVAAELAGMHPQTLRQYDRLGLVSPARTSGRGRRYSHRDVERLRRVQALSQDGVNLEGIRRILELECRLEALSSAPRRQNRPGCQQGPPTHHHKGLQGNRRRPGQQGTQETGLHGRGFRGALGHRRSWAGDLPGSRQRHRASRRHRETGQVPGPGDGDRAGCRPQTHRRGPEGAGGRRVQGGGPEQLHLPRAARVRLGNQPRGRFNGPQGQHRHPLRDMTMGPPGSRETQPMPFSAGSCL